MKAFGALEMGGIAAEVTGALLDTCTVDAYTEVAGELNEPEVTYVPGAPTDCRYRPAAGIFTPGPDYTIAGVDGMMRLPMGTAITSRDRVTITHRFGVALAEPRSYSVVGDPSPGIASTEVKLAEVHL